MDSKLIKPKPLPKALLLKDYLLDDMSSCSSNGFKSLPRRQCCTTVRFLIEIDLKNKQQHKKYSNNFNKTPPPLLKNPSKKSTTSVFRTVINAVKRLPFAAVSSPEKSKHKKAILPRNLSKKILKKTSFWKRKSGLKEIQRWKSFDELLKENPQRLDHSNSSMTTSVFTASEECSSGNSSSEVNLNLPEAGNDAVDVPGKVVSSSYRVGVTNGDVPTDSTTSSDSTKSCTKKQWSAVNEEKEQFSPVSVLDCPFDDDQDEVSSSSSPFQHRLARMEGTKKKLMKKIKRFECLAELEPVNLAKRFSPRDSNNKSNGSPLPNSSASTDEKFKSDIEVEEEEDDEHEENRAEQKALDLLHHIEDTLPSYGIRLKADKLLMDFFKEKIIGRKVHFEEQRDGYSFDEEILEEAENWINERKIRELFLQWEVPSNRKVYVKDMEKGGEWKKSSLDQENREVAVELETKVFAALLNELLIDISCKVTI
ncbi:hypothetical protein BUALT_Bualt05G0062500 [Buddleja alternifolia]|uniref:DUF4378 domain-containing protein n=1 Tax=Buddleja alternifolia TaxID=168488 RepID=A0AAV6XSX4_9LAMI|nr:hypothetical protein BUALT_Bualt05G0062500 [Buddleja alternifolia]